VRPRNFKFPRWRSDDAMTEDELQRMRDEFWDTEPHYGGNRVIWDALRAATEADLATAKVILESAGVIVASEDMTICYDERGAKYELPKYVLSDPSNLIRSKSNSRQQLQEQQQQIELAAAEAAAVPAAEETMVR
jgi:hypothetical protein